MVLMVLKGRTPLSESHLTVLCCSLFMHLLQVAAFGLTVLGSAGAFGKSKNQEWPVYEVSGLRFFADP